MRTYYFTKSDDLKDHEPKAPSPKRRRSDNEPITISDSSLKAHVKQRVIEVTFEEVDKIMQDITKRGDETVGRDIASPSRVFKRQKKKIQ